MAEATLIRHNDTHDAPKDPSHKSPTLTVIPVVLFNLLVYFVIGLPNAVIGAVFVHQALGFSTAMAGVTITTQYLGTFLTRLFAGRMVDKLGAKKVLFFGLTACAFSGFLMISAGVFTTLFPIAQGKDGDMLRYGALAVALVSRIFIGMAESWTATAVTTWNIRKVGLNHASVAISWNGVTTYGGMALGVGVGQWLASLIPAGRDVAMKLAPIGLSAMILPLIALVVLYLFYTGPKPLTGGGSKPLSLFTSLKRVLPYGAGLAAGSFGFGTINAFLALYYQSHDWNGVGIAFIVFALFFMGTRLCGTSFIDEKGGVPVAMISLAIEGVAFIVLCCFSSQIATLIGVGLTAAGFSLVFPALGTEAVKTGGPEHSGCLLAAYSIFTDLTVFIVGPLMGAIKDQWSWPVMFAIVACLSFGGIATVLGLLRIRGKA